MNGFETGKNTAETAISYTEHVTGLRVTVHDLTHSLWRMLPAERFRHAHPACREVKTGPHGEKCLAFEVEAFRNIAPSVREGRVHTCHAGFSEAAYPVFHGGALALVLFLGPFVRATGTASPKRGESAAAQRLPERDRDKAHEALEALRQLGSRLRCIIMDLPEPLSVQDVSREARIRRFVAARYQDAIQLSDLAEELSLSSDRTRHAVREECGRSFRDLLAETRLAASRALLLNSRLSVEEIALRCGFAGGGAFSRAFSRSYGEAPRRWRRLHQS